MPAGEGRMAPRLQDSPGAGQIAGKPGFGGA